MKNITMNNTEVIRMTGENVAGQNPKIIAGFVLTSLVLTLHLVVQYIIQRKRLNDNQYYLIRVLSATDSTVTIIVSTIFIFGLNQYSKSREIPVLLTLLAMFGLTFSLIVTLLIAIDRLVAVKYCLRYHSLVTRRRIHLVLLISGVFNAVILSCFQYNWKVKKTVKNLNMYTNLGVLLYLTIIRALSCIAIIIIGKMTIYIRNGNELLLRRRLGLHGRDAEKLNRTKQLKRGIKDVFQLNLWTCIFLLPMIITAFLTFLDWINQEQLIFINGLATVAHTFVQSYHLFDVFFKDPSILVTNIH